MIDADAHREMYAPRGEIDDYATIRTCNSRDDP